jgi:predicted transport protein
MSDIKLFRLKNDAAEELQGNASDLERPLQRLIEKHLEVLLGIRFLATEYVTTKPHAGRIDTLGIDENNCPVILEYKRSIGESIISQGMYYLDWLMSHQAEFTLLAMQKLGSNDAKLVDWSAPRVICIAAEFNKYDAYAVQQMSRNIELIRYRQFGDDLLLLESVSSVISKEAAKAKPAPSNKAHPQPTASTDTGAQNDDQTATEKMNGLPAPLRDVFDSLNDFLLSLGDDVQRKDLKRYIAYTRLKNFAAVTPFRRQLKVYLSLNPDTVEIISGFTVDKRGQGHWGTGQVEVTIQNQSDLERAKPLLRQAYEGKHRAR